MDNYRVVGFSVIEKFFARIRRFVALACRTRTAALFTGSRAENNYERKYKTD